MIRSVLLCDASVEPTALHAAVANDPDLVVDLSTDTAEAIETVARTRPDVVVCTLAAQGSAGARLLARFREASPDTRIVARVPIDDGPLAATSIAAGARGVAATGDPAAEVVAVIRAVTAGSVALTASIAHALGTALIGSADEALGLRRELGDLQDSVSQGTSAKADFLSNVSHELRTPVTVAKGIAYVLRNPSVGEQERMEFLEQLQASLDKLMGIIDEIITVSELERGTFRLSLADIDLAPIVHRAVRVTRERHPAIPIEATIAPTLPTVADAARLESVVTELLDNACRYSPDGVPVELSARSMSEGIVVTVTDHGVGLDRTVASRSFDEPFSTGEGVLRKEKSGVGVGLHLARQLVVEHGGTLWTDPLPGGGTRAAFCLPPDPARAGTAPAGAA